MILTTSYFNAPMPQANPVSIARSEPAWFRHSGSYQTYKLLAPSWSLLGKAKQGRLTFEAYAAAYRKTVLACLDPYEVLAELEGRFGNNPTLLCWEAEAEICHRRLVAQWLEAWTGLSVPELVVA